MEKEKQMIKAYEEALLRCPDHYPSRFHLGLACHRDGQFQHALDAFNLCQPRDEALYEARGAVYRDMGNLELAFADFDAVIKLEPAKGQHHYNRGVVCHRMGRLQAAFEDFTLAVEKGYRDAPVFSERGMVWRALGNLHQAVEDLTQAVEADGARGTTTTTMTTYLASRAQCFFEQGLYNLAEVDLDSALDLDSTDPAVFYKRGLTRYAQQLYAKAVADFKAALQFAPEEECLANLYYHLGLSYANLGKHPLAAPAYDEAIARAPRLPHYLHERAKSLQALQKHDVALLDFNVVLEIQPANAYALFRRAFAFKALGLYHEAAEDFEAAKEFAPNDPRLVINYRKVAGISCVSLGPCGNEDQHLATDYKKD
jgi:tetratricopeptide (TPR) repeat protein